MVINEKHLFYIDRLLIKYVFNLQLLNNKLKTDRKLSHSHFYTIYSLKTVKPYIKIKFKFRNV